MISPNRSFRCSIAGLLSFIPQQALVFCAIVGIYDGGDADVMIRSVISSSFVWRKILFMYWVPNYIYEEEILRLGWRLIIVLVVCWGQRSILIAMLEVGFHTTMRSNRIEASVRQTPLTSQARNFFICNSDNSLMTSKEEPIRFVRRGHVNLRSQRWRRIPAQIRKRQYYSAHHMPCFCVTKPASGSLLCLSKQGRH